MNNPCFLLDLDNTLLGNPMHTFLPAYFAGLTRHLSPLANNQDITQLMVDSVQVMRANIDPAATNMDVFIADFTQRVGVDQASLESILDKFYREDYPQLQQYTTFRPEARAITQLLQGKGCKVVIATNPLFPATAIEQRLEWAGLGDLQFDLITNMENSHFSKPDLRYYEEILALVGSRPVDTWMVGDDPDNDIIPAYRLGLNTWWVVNGVTGATTVPALRYGNLTDFLAWLQITPES